MGLQQPGPRLNLDLHENFKGMDAAESMDRRGRGEKEEGGRKRGEEREGREREKV